MKSSPWLSVICFVLVFRRYFFFFCHLCSRTTSERWGENKHKLKCALLVCMCEYAPCNVHVIWTQRTLYFSCAFIRMTFSRDSSTQRQTESTHPSISLQFSVTLFVRCVLSLFFSCHLWYRYYHPSFGIIWSIWPGKFHSAEVQTMK